MAQLEEMDRQHRYVLPSLPPSFSFTLPPLIPPPLPLFSHTTANARPEKPPLLLLLLLLLLPLLLVGCRCRGTGKGWEEGCLPSLTRLAVRPLGRRGGGWGKEGCWEGWGRRWWVVLLVERLLVGARGDLWYVFGWDWKEGRKKGMGGEGRGVCFVGGGIESVIPPSFPPSLPPFLFVFVYG